MTKPVMLPTVDNALNALQPGMTVFIPGMSGESLPLFDALRTDPGRAERLTFVGIHFPGINQNNYLDLHPTVRQRAYFMSPALRRGMHDGRVDLLQLDYPGIVRDLEEDVAVDVAIAQVSLPDKNGQCSLGPCHDFLPSVWRKSRIRIAHVNPRFPRTIGTFSVALSDCDFVAEQESTILTVGTEQPNDAVLRHGSLVANLIPNGSTLQFGIGKLQTAVLKSLSNHRDLKIYSGMVSPAVFDLLDGGAVATPNEVQCGVALGNATFYDRLDSSPDFTFRPVRETHDIRRLARIDSFYAINSAVEVDLFGQVNVDYISGSLIAGVGGLPPFSSGARLSSGGRSIIVLPATTADERHSRIVCPTDRNSLIALPRHETDYVVTEFGVADLRARSILQRASALISVAAPRFRDSLSNSWEQLARKL